MLESAHGTALLSEAWEQPDRSESIPRWAFTTLLADGQEPSSPSTAAAGAQGKSWWSRVWTPSGFSARRRKELEARRRAVIGAAKDRLDERISAPGAAWSDLSGIGRAVIEGNSRHGISLLATATGRGQGRAGTCWSLSGR